MTARKYTDPVVVEYMPDYLRGSCRAAGNWGCYPYNCAERMIVERTATYQWVFVGDYDAHLPIEEDEYDHIVRDATASDFERYWAE